MVDRITGVPFDAKANRAIRAPVADDASSYFAQQEAFAQAFEENVGGMRRTVLLELAQARNANVGNPMHDATAKQRAMGIRRG